MIVALLSHAIAMRQPDSHITLRPFPLILALFCHKKRLEAEAVQALFQRSSARFHADNFTVF